MEGMRRRLEVKQCLARCIIGRVLGLGGNKSGVQRSRNGKHRKK